MAKKVQFTTNQPSSTTDYLAADNTWKPMTGGGGGVPTTRTLTINGTTQDLSADRTWTVGDMLKSTYDTDADGVVDSSERIEIVVRNSTGSTISKGKIVYLSGATGNRPNALLAKADSEATSSKTIGMVVADIPNNSDGSIAVNGTLHDIDTSGFTAGDSLWLSATTAGGYIANTPPSEPNHAVFIGYVARVHPTQGRIVLNIQNGYELDELHGVQITSVANNDILKYNSTSGLWENSNALSTKQDTITGGASSITTSNLTTYRALVSDGGGKVAVAATTSNEIGYLSGVTSAIQTQLDSKVSSGGGAYHVLISRAATGQGAGGTAYYYTGGAGGSTAESQLRTPFPSACTCSNLYVRITGTQPASGSLVFTLFKNGSATALVLTIAAGTVAGTYSNTSNSVSFAAGDGYSVEVKNNATLVSAPISGMSFKLTI